MNYKNRIIKKLIIIATIKRFLPLLCRDDIKHEIQNQINKKKEIQSHLEDNQQEGNQIN